MLLVLTTAQFTHNVDFMLLMPLSAELMAAFQVTASKYALLVSAYTFAAAASGISSAFFIDRFERKQAILVIYGGLIIGTLLCAISPSYLFLLIARVVTGIFGGVLGAMILSIISDAIPLVRRARAIGFNTAAFSAASALGIPFSLYIAHQGSWHTPFYVLSGIGSLVLLALLIYLPRMDQHLTEQQSKKNPIKEVAAVLKNSNRARALLFISLLVFGQFSVINDFLKIVNYACQQFGEFKVKE